MYKVTIFSFALFFSAGVAAQQTTANKSTLSLTNTDVQISAVAIPMEDAGNIIIDTATYHKAVHLGSEPETSMQIVEVTAPATHVTEHTPGNISKVGKGNEAENTGKETINKSERALKVIPKRYF